MDKTIYEQMIGTVVKDAKSNPIAQEVLKDLEAVTLFRPDVVHLEAVEIASAVVAMRKQEREHPNVAKIEKILMGSLFDDLQITLENKREKMIVYLANELGRLFEQDVPLSENVIISIINYVTIFYDYGRKLIEKSKDKKSLLEKDIPKFSKNLHTYAEAILKLLPEVPPSPQQKEKEELWDYLQQLANKYYRR